MNKFYNFGLIWSINLILFRILLWCCWWRRNNNKILSFLLRKKIIGSSNLFKQTDVKGSSYELRWLEKKKLAQSQFIFVNKLTFLVIRLILFACLHPCFLSPYFVYFLIYIQIWVRPVSGSDIHLHSEN